MLDEQGFFYPTVEQVAQHAVPGQVEKEIRAQIDRAISFGIKPSHLDTHLGSVAATPELMQIYFRLGKEYGLPVLAPAMMLMAVPEEQREEIRSQFVLLYRLFMMEEENPEITWAEAYDQMLARTVPGLNQLIVHLSIDNDEMQAVALNHPAFGSAWRQKDLDFVTSPVIKEILRKYGNQLVSWEDIKAVMQMPGGLPGFGDPVLYFHCVVDRCKSCSDPHNRNENTYKEQDQAADHNENRQEAHEEDLPAISPGHVPAYPEGIHDIHLLIHHQVRNKCQAAGENNTRYDKHDNSQAYDHCHHDIGDDRIPVVSLKDREHIPYFDSLAADRFQEYPLGAVTYGPCHQNTVCDPEHGQRNHKPFKIFRFPLKKTDGSAKNGIYDRDHQQFHEADPDYFPGDGVTSARLGAKVIFVVIHYCDHDGYVFPVFINKYIRKICPFLQTLAVIILFLL